MVGATRRESKRDMSWLEGYRRKEKDGEVLVLAGATGRQRGKSDPRHPRGKGRKERYCLRAAKRRTQEKVLIGSYTRERKGREMKKSRRAIG